LTSTGQNADWVRLDDDDQSDYLMCGHHDYFGGLCPPSSHFTASDFTGSDNTEVFQNVLALAAFECSKIVTGWIGRDASERHARVAAHWAQRPVEAC